MGFGRRPVSFHYSYRIVIFRDKPISYTSIPTKAMTTRHYLAKSSSDITLTLTPFESIFAAGRKLSCASPTSETSVSYSSKVNRRNTAASAKCSSA